MSVERRIENFWGLIFMLFAGGLFFSYRFGVDKLIPENINWLMSQFDGATHFLGWYFYRNEQWNFPPGLVHSYFAPIGTSIGYTDSLPLLAMPLKLFSRFLSVDFQYFGFWIFLNHCCQAVFAFLLLRTKVSRKTVLFIGTMFFLFSPIMLWRSGHSALSSHWMILAGLWLYFRSEKRIGNKWRNLYLPWMILVFVSALTHPYLAVMVMGLAFTFLLNKFLQVRSIDFATFLFANTTLLGIVLGLWLLTGFFQYSTLDEYGQIGYGDYSLNLLALFNPQGTSPFMIDLPVASNFQLQTYNYLGAGMIAMVLYAFISFILYWPKRLSYLKGNIIVIFMSLIFILYAVSNKVSFGERILFAFPIGEIFPQLLSVVRVSARFFWPVYYLIFFTVFVVIDKSGAKKTTSCVLSILVLVQLYDIKTLLKPDFLVTPYISHLKSSDWVQKISSVKKLHTVPMFSDVVFDYDYKDLALLAARNNCSITSGYVARASKNEIDKSRAELYSNLERGIVEPKTLYIFNPDYFERTGEQIAKKLNCSGLDGYIICEP